MRVSIIGYEGMYDVSSDGFVYSLVRKGKGKCLGKEVMMSGSVNNSGYKIVSLSKNNKKKTFLVHRLVAESFIENQDGKQTVNHIDGDKLNNSTSNLEWMSYSENEQHAWDTGLKKVSELQRRKNGERARSEKNRLHMRELGKKNERITDEQRIKMKKMRDDGMSLAKIGAEFGIAHNNVTYNLRKLARTLSYIQE